MHARRHRHVGELPIATPLPSRGVHAAVLAGIAVAIAIAYGGTLAAPFVLDARVIVLENPALRALTWANVVTLFTHDYWHPVAVNGLYRPLTQLTYLLDWSVLGHADHPAGYRALNILLHWSCTAAAYGVLLELGAPLVAAALAAALIALHPTATEVVTNVVGRADLLATLAVLGGLLCHARARRTTGRTALAWRVALAAITLLGLFCKESAIVVVPLVLAWDALLAPPFDRRAATSTAATLGPPIALWAAARTTVLAREWAAETSSIDNPILAASFWSGRLTALKVAGMQLATLVWPARLSIDYSFDQIPLSGWPPDAATLFGAGVWLALLGLAVAHRRRRPAVAFLLAWYLVALLPTANLVVPIGAIMADRFLYLPSIGWWGALALVAVGFRSPWRPMLLGSLALGALVFGGLTVARNRDWQSEERLWASAVAAAPRSAKAHRGWAAELAAQADGGDGLERAIVEARTAIAIRSDFGGARLDLGGYLLQRGDAREAAGDHDGARADWRQALSVLAGARRLDRRANRDFHRRMRDHGRRRIEIPEAGTAEVYARLAQAHLRLDHRESARRALRQARRLDVWNAARWVDLSAVAAMLGRWDDAAVSLFGALALDERDTGAQGRLAEVYRRLDPTLLVADGPGRARLSLDDPRVRAHRCRAYRELTAIFDRARLAAAARRWGQLAASACAPG